MVTIGTNNPGRQDGDEFNNTEEGILRGIGDLSLSNGDLLVYNNGAFERMPASSRVFTSYAAGTAYSLTNSSAQVAFGTTSPAITITAAGTYLVSARAKVDYTAATFAAVRTVTLKLRRTNNTAADLTGASATFATQILTTLTFTAQNLVIPTVAYTTTRTDDVIQIHGLIDTVPTAGSIDVSAAEIVAVRLY